jgi:penicillin-binding protein 1A
VSSARDDGKSPQSEPSTAGDSAPGGVSQLPSWRQAVEESVRGGARPQSWRPIAEEPPLGRASSSQSWQPVVEVATLGQPGPESWRPPPEDSALGGVGTTGSSGDGNQTPGPHRRHRVFRILWWGLGLLVALVICGLVAIRLVVAHFESGLPSVDQLRLSYRPPQVTRILARDGTVLDEIFTERRTVVAFGSIPSHTKLAFLAAEDAHFYEHEGLNYVGMLRALFTNLRARRTVQGGSTITQQVVKNVLLVSDRTYKRKIQETILALRLEQSLSKDDILALYLNHIYLGHGRYGIEEAARVYFGKHAAELDLAESAMLAGIVASPERFSPRRDARRAVERRRFVLGQMREKRFISSELERQAAVEAVRLSPMAEEESDLAPEAVGIVKQLLSRVAPEQASRGGFVVTTTIDPTLQAAARRAVRDNLRDYAKRYHLDAPYGPKSGPLWGPVSNTPPRRYHASVGEVIAVDDSDGTIDVSAGGLVGQVRVSHETWLNQKSLPPSKFAAPGARLRVIVDGELDASKPEMRIDSVPQSALVAIDVRSRQVLALVGSREAVAGGLDRATQARRQPGSSFKPFVYSQALSSRKFTAASLLTIPPTTNRPEPLPMLLREGLARSENSVASQLLDAVGAQNVVKFAHDCGIESRLAPTPSLALGAYEVTPIEITNAYATFASGGISAPPLLVTRIVGPDGNEIAVPQGSAPNQVMAPEEAYLITSLMRSVVERGTAQRAKRLGRPVVGKTGTTNQAKDTWFVGYSPEIVAGVWVGFDDAVSLGANETGANTALPAWVEFMKAALSGRPVTGFARPSGIQVERIDPQSGLLALEDQENAIDEEFLPGTAPTERASPDAGVPEPAGSATEVAADPNLPPSAASATSGDVSATAHEVPPASTAPTGPPAAVGNGPKPSSAAAEP